MKLLTSLLLSMAFLAQTPGATIVIRGPIVATAASFDPTTVSGMTGWYAARLESFSDNDAVGTMTDQSSGTYDLAQATAGAKPTFKTGIVNSQPVFRFDGGDYVEKTNTSFGTVGTVVAVIKIDAAAGTAANAGGTTVGGGSPRRWLTWYPDNTTVYSGDVQEIWGTNFTCRVNGVSTYTTSGGFDIVVLRATTPNTWEVLNMGLSGLNAAFLGDIAEVIYYDTALSDANVNYLGSGLGTIYGISWTNI